MPCRSRRNCHRSRPTRATSSAAISSKGRSYSPDYGSMATSVYTVPALAAVGHTEAAAKEKRPGDQGTQQRHARLVFRPHLCGDRRLVQDHRRRDHRPHPRRAFRRACRPGVGQHLFGLAMRLWHHRRARSGTTSTPIRHLPPTSSICSEASRIAQRYRVKSQPAFPSSRFHRWFAHSRPDHSGPRRRNAQQRRS